MRILMVTGQLPTPAQPGSMAPVARQIESVRALGVQVDVLEVKGVPKLKYLLSLPSLSALASYVDLIHAHYGYCGWVARSQFNKPVVVSFMGDDLLGTPDVEGHASWLSKLVVGVNRRLARTVDAVIVKSVEMAQVVAPVKAHVIPNGVDLRVFHPMDPREARTLLGLAENKRYVLFPGRPTVPRKGFLLARAAVTYASMYVTEPLELIPLWGVTPDRVPLYMNACHVLLMTSFWEGSPNVVKEAMACNLPVLSVPVGDVPELLAGVDGCMICSRDAEALGAVLAQMLSDTPRSTGRLTIEHKGLDQKNVARKLVMLYEGVLARRRVTDYARE